MKKSIGKIFERIVDNSIYLGCVALLLMMLTTVSDVTLRFFAHPVMGSIEIITTLMVCVVFFGMGSCSLEGRHLKVDIFKKFPLLDKINKIITMVLCLSIGWFTIVQGFKAKSLNTQSQLLRIPKYPFVFVAALGFFLIAAAIILHLIQRKKGNSR